VKLLGLEMCDCWSVNANVSFCRASSLGMMSDEEKRVQRIEDIKELLS